MDIVIILEHSFIKYEWRFRPFENIIVFVSYTQYERKSGRHKWITISFWDRYNESVSTMKEPALSDHTRDCAKQKYIESVKVMTWKEWKK